MMHQWLQRNDSNFYWSGTHVLVQRQKKTVDETEYCINIYVSNITKVKFCGIFTCLTYTQHEITKTGNVYNIILRHICVTIVAVEKQ